MRIGLILAVEADAIFDYYKNPNKIEESGTFKMFKVEKNNHEVYILQTGLGEILASAGTEYLIDNYKVDMVINFGVVGGLTSNMKKFNVCIVDKVVYYDYDASGFMPLIKAQVADHNSIYLRPDEKLINKALEINPSLFVATCCSADKFVNTIDDKENLHRLYDGDVCDMESAAITLICELHNTPLLILKAVSDGLNEGGKEFWVALKEAACQVLEVADKIIEEL